MRISVPKKFFPIDPGIRAQIPERILRAINYTLLPFAIAKYIGDKDYGVYAYILSMASLAMAILSMGTPNLIVAHFARYPGSRVSLMKSFLVIRLIGLCLALAFCFVVGGPSRLVLIIIVIIQFGDIFDYINQGDNRIAETFNAKSLALLIGLVLKSISIFVFENIWALIFSHIIEIFSSNLLVFHRYRCNSIPSKRFYFSPLLTRLLLKKLVPLSATTFFALLSTRIDIIFIQKMFGYDALGQYSLLVQIISSWWMLPTLAATSFLPKLAIIASNTEAAMGLNLYKYYRFFHRIGICIMLASLISSLTACYLLRLIDPNPYGPAGAVLSLSSYIASHALFQGIIIARYNLYWYGLCKTFSSTFLAVIFSVAFMPFIGLLGMPVAIVGGLAFAEFCLPFLWRHGVPKMLFPALQSVS